MQHLSVGGLHQTHRALETRGNAGGTTPVPGHARLNRSDVFLECFRENDPSLLLEPLLLPRHEFTAIFHGSLPNYLQLSMPARLLGLIVATRLPQASSDRSLLPTPLLGLLQNQLELSLPARLILRRDLGPRDSARQSQSHRTRLSLRQGVLLAALTSCPHGRAARALQRIAEIDQPLPIHQPHAPLPAAPPQAIEDAGESEPAELGVGSTFPANPGTVPIRLGKTPVRTAAGPTPRARTPSLQAIGHWSQRDFTKCGADSTPNDANPRILNDFQDGLPK